MALLKLKTNPHLLVATAFLLSSLDPLGLATGGTIPVIQTTENSSVVVQNGDTTDTSDTTAFPCGGFLTSGGSIDLFNVGSDWGKLKDFYEGEKLTQIVVNTTNKASVRICSNEHKEHEDKCQVFDESTKPDQQYGKYQIKFITSATCSIPTDQPCNTKGCEDAELGQDECARFYQDKSCSDCQFEKFPLSIKMNEDRKFLTLQYQIVESVKVRGGYEAFIQFSDNPPKKLETGRIPTKYTVPDLTFFNITLSCIR